MRAPGTVSRRTGPGLRTAVAAASLLAACTGPLLAAQPIPLVPGTYCGPEGAKIVVDAVRDEVTIDGLVCSFPIIAADHLQSDLCSTPKGESVQRSLDLRVVGRDFVHAGHWYVLCSPPQKTGPDAKGQLEFNAAGSRTTGP